MAAHLRSTGATILFDNNVHHHLFDAGQDIQVSSNGLRVETGQEGNSRHLPLNLLAATLPKDQEKADLNGAEKASNWSRTHDRGLTVEARTRKRGDLGASKPKKRVKGAEQKHAAMVVEQGSQALQPPSTTAMDQPSTAKSEATGEGRDAELLEDAAPSETQQAGGATSSTVLMSALECLKGGVAFGGGFNKASDTSTGNGESREGELRTEAKFEEGSYLSASSHQVEEQVNGVVTGSGPLLCPETPSALADPALANATGEAKEEEPRQAAGIPAGPLTSLKSVTSSAAAAILLHLPVLLPGDGDGPDQSAGETAAGFRPMADVGRQGPGRPGRARGRKGRGRKRGGRGGPSSGAPQRHRQKTGAQASADGDLSAGAENGAVMFSAEAAAEAGLGMAEAAAANGFQWLLLSEDKEAEGEQEARGMEGEDTAGRAAASVSIGSLELSRSPGAQGVGHSPAVSQKTGDAAAQGDFQSNGCGTGDHEVGKAEVEEETEEEEGDGRLAEVLMMLGKERGGRQGVQEGGAADMAGEFHAVPAKPVTAGPPEEGEALQMGPLEVSAAGLAQADGTAAGEPAAALADCILGEADAGQGGTAAAEKEGSGAGARTGAASCAEGKDEKEAMPPGRVGPSLLEPGDGVLASESATAAAGSEARAAEGQAALAQATESVGNERERSQPEGGVDKESRAAPLEASQVNPGAGAGQGGHWREEQGTAGLLPVAGAELADEVHLELQASQEQQGVAEGRLQSEVGAESTAGQEGIGVGMAVSPVTGDWPAGTEAASREGQEASEKPSCAPSDALVAAERQAGEGALGNEVVGVEGAAVAGSGSPLLGSGKGVRRQRAGSARRWQGWPLTGSGARRGKRGRGRGRWGAHRGAKKGVEYAEMPGEQEGAEAAAGAGGDGAGTGTVVGEVPAEMDAGMLVPTEEQEAQEGAGLKAALGSHAGAPGEEQPTPGAGRAVEKGRGRGRGRGRRGRGRRGGHAQLMDVSTGSAVEVVGTPEKGGGAEVGEPVGVAAPFASLTLPTPPLDSWQSSGSSGVQLGGETSERREQAGAAAAESPLGPGPALPETRSMLLQPALGLAESPLDEAAASGRGGDAEAERGVQEHSMVVFRRTRRREVLEAGEVKGVVGGSASGLLLPPEEYEVAESLAGLERSKRVKFEASRMEGIAASGAASVAAEPESPGADYKAMVGSDGEGGDVQHAAAGSGVVETGEESSPVSPGRAKWGRGRRGKGRGLGGRGLGKGRGKVSVSQIGNGGVARQLAAAVSVDGLPGSREAEKAGVIQGDDQQEPLEGREEEVEHGGAPLQPAPAASLRDVQETDEEKPGSGGAAAVEHKGSLTAVTSAGVTAVESEQRVGPTSQATHSQSPEAATPLRRQLRTAKSELGTQGGLHGWLESWGLGKYFHLLAKHEVDEESLALLTLEDIKEMGIDAVGARRKLWCAILDFREGVKSSALCSAVESATAV